MRERELVVTLYLYMMIYCGYFQKEENIFKLVIEGMDYESDRQ